MTLSAGSRLGPYEILAPLGAGGMGEVYRARDTRLERTVAIKILPSRLSSSPEIRERFEREAKAIAQLSHPNICALHDVGREGDVEYLVMEYLEGETLDERLAKGPLPLEQTLRYGIEIAGALDRAHRQGIVHRDLKPGNVMLTKTGAKVLDFGLAKATAPQPGNELSALPTVEKSLTAEGSIVGTLQYMAPEQLEGRDTDSRTDIFALGVVLYEMATGEKAFSGRSRVSLASSILRDEPRPIAAVAPMTPPAFERLVRTCLAKDPDDRWQSAGDIARELKWIGGGSGEAAAALPARVARRKKDWLPWTIAGLALVLAAVSWLLPRPTRVREDLTRFTILPPSGQGLLGTAELSPDGRRILLWLQDEVGKTSMATRSFDTLEIRRLPGTDGARGAFWSPDGREIAFFREGKLARMSSEGGPVQTICESESGFSGVWNRQGTILFTKEFNTPIVAVPATGGTPRPVTRIDSARGEVAHFHPSFLPDDRHFVFVARNLDPAKTQVCLASLDSKDVRPLFPADSSALFADPGYLLFARDNALFAWRFDPQKLELVGQPAPMLEQVRYGTEDNLLAVSVAGTRLAYLPWRMRRRLVWVDRRGRELGTLGEIAGYSDVCIAPDGRKVAVTIRDPAHGQNQDVWVLDTSRGTAARITAERTDEFDPAWFPDGERLVYVSDHAGFYDLYARPAAGGDEKTLLQTKYDKVLPTVSPDGEHMLFSLSEGAIFSRVLAPVAGGGDPLRLSGDSRFSEEHPVLSPDGRWTAFDSVESGQKEVYVQPIPGGPKRQVSVGGGQMPVWSRNGSELFYAGRGGTLMADALRSNAGRLEIGEPEPLFPMRIGLSGEVTFHRRFYDVASDGRFLLIRQAPDADADAAVVITNWTALLERSR
jgi:Tol biopolymer transport system component/tRNA A-37 threonylcarbamoyl transferase component Bud32